MLIGKSRFGDGESVPEIAGAGGTVRWPYST
jgi:hypothetical protein